MFTRSVRLYLASIYVHSDMYNKIRRVAGIQIINTALILFVYNIMIVCVMVVSWCWCSYSGDGEGAETAGGQGDPDGGDEQRDDPNDRN